MYIIANIQPHVYIMYACEYVRMYVVYMYACMYIYIYLYICVSTCVVSVVQRNVYTTIYSQQSVRIQVPEYLFMNSMCIKAKNFDISRTGYIFQSICFVITMHSSIFNIFFLCVLIYLALCLCPCLASFFFYKWIIILQDAHVPFISDNH